jgi:hypothetical protein
MISTGNDWWISIARSVLPDAVGPSKKAIGFFVFIDLIFLKELLR